MRPVDFIGRVLKADNKQVVSKVEGTIFQYDDKLKGTSGWQGSFTKWENEGELLAARSAGETLLLVCNDGRQGQISLDVEMADWGLAGIRFRGAGTLSAATVAPSWRLLDRTRTEDGAPDPT
jgi:hypothetical protein